MSKGTTIQQEEIIYDQDTPYPRKYCVTWNNHVAEESLHAIAFCFGSVEDYLAMVHGEILSTKDYSRRSIRFVDRRWKWWAFYKAWDKIAEKALEAKMGMYYFLFRHGYLATQEGCIPRWQDIRLFKIRKDV